jgi:prepilin-type processing-associated H-X9-DG protein
LLVGCASLIALGVLWVFLGFALVRRSPSQGPFSTFGQAREKARMAACQSNLKQGAIAALMYAQDYDEQLPRSANWSEALLPYTKNPSLWACPSLETSPYGYAYNARLNSLKLEKALSPATTALLFDSNAGVANAADAGSSLARPGRHQGGDNLAFMDGHVKWFTEAAIQPNFFDPDAAPSVGLGGGITPPLPAEQPARPAAQLPSPTPSLVGKPAPDFTRPSLAGKSIRLADFRGKPVVLFIMAHW